MDEIGDGHAALLRAHLVENEAKSSLSVVLSAAKDLIAACHGHEILRFAQDDNRFSLRATSRVASQPALL
jgi:hypothetical protein